jgi:oxygen-independent coproporphyrinogen-3 oxidase
MYEWASAAFESAGYVQYEISNWAKSSRECIHNLQYWRGLPYLGFGADAHGYSSGYRYSNVLRIKTYIDRLTNPDSRIANFEFPFSPAVVNHRHQSLQDDMSEFMMTGLRLTREGITASAFRQRFGGGLTEVYPREIDELTRLGLLEWSGDILRLTQRGRLLGNQVFLRFVT